MIAHPCTKLEFVLYVPIGNTAVALTGLELLKSGKAFFPSAVM